MAGTLIFVYGTLKAGFPNHAVNTGRRLAGEYRTCEALPLYLVDLPGERAVPWLLDAPGQGSRVAGQLYEVDAPTLRAMDALEETGLPQGYVRRPIRVARVDLPGAPAAPVEAQAYLKPPQRLTAGLPRRGPYADYTVALAALYRWDRP